MDEKTHPFSSIDELIARGAMQRSRKYRMVFVPPENCLSYLRKHKPEIYDRLVENTLSTIEAAAKEIVAHHFNEHTYTLSEKEFHEFREKMAGKKLWTPEGKIPCPKCMSLGHIHRRGCPNE